MAYDPNLQLLYVSRVSFFDIVAQFPELRDKIIEAGETYIRGHLTKEDVNRITNHYPNSVWE